MRKRAKIFFVFLFVTLSGFSFAGGFKFYPGVYLGMDWNRDIDDGLFVVGADIQWGFEIGDFLYNDFVLGFFGDIGLDTGQPNEPNFYYGGTVEAYWLYWGLALGMGWNTTIEGLHSEDRLARDSIYMRTGLLVNAEGVMKFGLYYDYYPDIGSRLGFIIHF
jgi:hypothetical protein